MPFILPDEGDPRPLTPVEQQQLASTNTVPGQTVIDDDKAHQIALQKAHPGALSALGTGLEAAASTASLGTSRWAEEATGIPALSEEEQQGRAAAHPTAKAAGTVGGFVAPWGLEKAGAQLGIEGLGAMTPLAMTGEAGAAVGEALPGVAGYIARGGLEGALLGAGNALDEKALGSPDELSDSLLSQAGLSAVTGGVLGAGLFGIKSLISPAAKAAEASAAASHGIVARLWAGAASKATGASEEALLDGLDKAEAANAPGALEAEREAARMTQSAAETAQDKAAQNASADLAKHFQNLFDYSDNAGKSGFDGLRDETVDALASSWKPKVLFNRLGANLNNGFMAVEDMLNRPAEYDTGVASKAFRALTGLSDKVASFVDDGTAGVINDAKKVYAKALNAQLKDSSSPTVKALQAARNKLVLAITNASDRLTNPDQAAAAVYKELYGLKQATQQTFGRITPYGTSAAARDAFAEKFIAPVQKLTVDPEAWGKPLADRISEYNQVLAGSKEQGIVGDIDARKAFKARFFDNKTGKVSPERISKWLKGAAKAGEVGADEATMPGTTGVVRSFQDSADKMIAQEQKMRAMLSEPLTSPERRAFIGRVWDTVRKGAVEGLSPEEVKTVDDTWAKIRPSLESNAKYTDGMKLADAALQAHSDAYDKFLAKEVGAPTFLPNGPASDVERLRQFGEKGIGAWSTGGLGYLAYKLGIPKAVLLPVLAGRMLYRAVNNPYSTIKAYGAIARIHEAMASKIDSSVGAIFKGIHLPLTGATGAALVHATGFQTPPHPDESRSAAYQRHANDLSTAVSQGAPPSKPISTLAEHAPNLALALGSSSSGLTHDLAARLPGVTLPSSDRPPAGPNDVAFAKYARALEVAEKGTAHVLSLASQNKLTIDEARMWKKGFPGHAQMVAQAIQNHRAKQKEAPAFATEQTLSLLTHPEPNPQRGLLTARLQQNFQNEHMKAVQNKASDKGLPKFAAMTTTKWANTAQPGESQGEA